MHKLQVPDLKSKATCRLKCLKPVFFFMVCRVLLQWFQKYLQFYISLWEDIIRPPFFFFCSLQGSLGLTLSLTSEKTHHAIPDPSSTSTGSLLPWRRSLSQSSFCTPRRRTRTDPGYVQRFHLSSGLEAPRCPAARGKGDGWEEREVFFDQTSIHTTQTYMNKWRRLEVNDLLS